MTPPETIDWSTLPKIDRFCVNCYMGNKLRLAQKICTLGIKAGWSDDQLAVVKQHIERLSSTRQALDLCSQLTK